MPRWSVTILSNVFYKNYFAQVGKAITDAERNYMKLIRKFGVELEINADAVDYGPTWAKYGDMPSGWCCSDCDGEIEAEVEIHLPDGWTFDPDGSCGSEFVSPILSDTDEVEEMIDIIQNAGLDYSFEDCGLHVHVDARDFPINPDKNLLNVARFCRHFERIIYSFVDDDRRSNTYCRNLSFSNRDLERRLSTFNRYHGCNLASWQQHQTVEFRYAEGTLNLDRIATLAEFYTLIVEKSRDYGRLKTPRQRIPKTMYLLDYLGVSDFARENLLKSAGLGKFGRSV